MNTGKSENSKIKYLAVLFMTVLCIYFTYSTIVYAQQDEIDDSEITLAVSDAVFEDEGVSGFLVDVTTNDGIVTLTGTVNNILAKDRAAKLAKTVKGVRAVINEIDVAPIDINNSRLASNIRAALVLDPATEEWEVDVAVDNGEVVLTGEVDSWQEKQLAGMVVKGVRGVTEVDNKIEIEYDTQRSDSEIENEVQKVLRRDAYVDDALIDVAVDDDTVMLSGHVGSAAEKDRAITDSWVPGVKGVKADDLTVESWAREERFRKDKYIDKSNDKLEMAVSDAMLYDPRVESFDIGVRAEEGVVTLTGTVDNLKAKRAAANDARNTVGVWSVKNYIKIRPIQALSDSTIEQNVENSLIEDPYVNRFDINVNVNNGLAILNGTVDTYFEKAQADNVASTVRGVVNVDNNLEVEDGDDMLTYDPYVNYHWYVYDYDWYQKPESFRPIMSDWEIEEEINDELWWSPFVDSDEVNVSVENGVATLTGTVDTWYEREAATENALEGGAVTVDNDLTVVYGPAYYMP